MNRRGTNQHYVIIKYRKDRFLKAKLLAFVLIMQFFTFLWLEQQPKGILNPSVDASTSPAALLDVPAPSPSPVEVSPEREMVKDEIKKVFGKHADKAFQLLSCENSSLNPEAVNTAGNYPEGSRDLGVFQVNEYWQKVNGKFLLDPSINIRVAYKIFEDNGYTFERWTCGRKLGI